jgi:hypothetical protein
MRGVASGSIAPAKPVLTRTILAGSRHRHLRRRAKVNRANPDMEHPSVGQSLGHVQLSTSVDPLRIQRRA